MKYLSVKDTAKKWGVSERSVRGYCAADRIPGAVLSGKTWKIPESSPSRKRNKTVRWNLPPGADRTYL